MVSLSPAAARHLQLLLEERKFEERKLDSPIPPVGPAVMPSADPSLVGADGENLNGHRGAGGAVNQGLRVMVEKGGCAGLQYTMTLDYCRAGDTTIQRDGVSVFIDSASLPYLAGAELDYCDDLVGTGFRLHNPNAVRSCGCGTSFEPSAAAEPAVDTGTTAGGENGERAGKSVVSGGEMGIAMEGAG